MRNLTHDGLLIASEDHLALNPALWVHSKWWPVTTAFPCLLVCLGSINMQCVVVLHLIFGVADRLTPPAIWCLFLGDHISRTKFHAICFSHVQRHESLAQWWHHVMCSSSASDLLGLLIALHHQQSDACFVFDNINYTIYKPIIGGRIYRDFNDETMWNVSSASDLMVCWQLSIPHRSELPRWASSIFEDRQWWET